MIKPSVTVLRCAVYTRVSTEHGLDQDFNWLCHGNVLKGATKL
jgi:hypothetical protein